MQGGETGRIKDVYSAKYLQLGLKIAYYRKLRGLTQEELAERVDCTPAFIGHVEARTSARRSRWTRFSPSPTSWMFRRIAF